jgi:hypothetical protein
MLLSVERRCVSQQFREGRARHQMVTRIKIGLPSAFPYQAGFADLAGRMAKLPP